MSSYMVLEFSFEILIAKGMDVELLRIDLERITLKRALAAGDSLVDVLSRLDEVARNPDIPDRLEHYLSKRSYEKALAWLDDPEQPHRM